MIRVGILGADSSHTETYIGLINPRTAPFYERARVAKLWGADPEQAQAKARMAMVEPMSDVKEVVQDVDLVLVCARWGEDHYALARAAIEAGVPTFVDKPLTNSLKEARDLLNLVRLQDVPLFSCSAYRFAPEVLAACEQLPNLGAFRAGSCTGLSVWKEFGPRADNVYFYGVHPVEIVHAVFGAGVQEVRVDTVGPSDVAALRYADGRLVTLHLLRDSAEVYEFSYYGEHGWMTRAIDPRGAYYENLLHAVLSMAESGIPSLPLEFAVEIVAILQAISHARACDGWVRVESVTT